MARLRCDFFSETLILNTTMTVLLPAQPDPPTLYLLHGLSDDDTAWTRQTSIERYADELGLAVVMPQVHRSFYADEAHGNRYWTFLSEELPATVHRMFRLSARREDTFVAGLSMGGYGAVKWALRQPGRFAAAASLSGALDVATRSLAARADEPAMFQRIFGEGPVRDTPHDLIRLVGEVQDVPRLYVCCGTEDALHPDNLTFVEACRVRGVEVATDFGPGEHNWAYWDARIQDVLAWFQVVRR